MGRLTDRTLIARWVEAEALRLKGERKPFEEIADLIGRMGRDELPGRPRDAEFPPHYRISHQAVQKAARKALDRLPKPKRGWLKPHCDHMFLSRQPRALG